MSLKKYTLYQLKLLLQRTKAPKLLSFDLGVNSTGVAFTEDNMNEAYPLKVIKSMDSRIDPLFPKEIVKIIRKQAPTAILFGSLNQKYIQQNQRQNAIISRINKALESQVIYSLVDQKDSTYDAKELLRQISAKMGLKGLHLSKNLQDAFSAIVLIKRFNQYYKK